MRYSNKESGRETLLPLLWAPCEKAHQDASLESRQHVHWQPRHRKIRADRKAIVRDHSHGAEGTLHTTHSQAAWRFPVPALGGLSTTVQGGINACVILFLLLIIYVVPKELAKIRHLNHIHSLKQFLYHFISSLNLNCITYLKIPNRLQLPKVCKVNIKQACFCMKRIVT